jgi:methylase of polypeptide subunit release factors
MSTTQAPQHSSLSALRPSPPTWATEPFVHGTPAQFVRLRAWLTAVGYTEPALCATAKISRLGQLPRLDPSRKAFVNPVDAQSLLVHLFLDSRPVPWSTVQAVFSPADLSVLTDLGLLQPAIANAANCVATVALFPCEDLHVVSDRLAALETVGAGIPADAVYAPLTAETQRFVALMPRVQCSEYLELCAGTGIAALLAARHFAGHAYSADITERSTRFARFNAALNDLPNFTAVQGDLYEAVRGKTFDVITAHPPYVPAESTEMVYRDGGADGEQITRRILGGLVEHLNPGGLFYLDCAMADRSNEPLEPRMRRLLGPEEDEFDLIVFRNGLIEAKVYQAEQLATGRMSPEVFARQKEYFKRMGIRGLVTIQAIIQRRVAKRPVVTRRYVLGDGARAEDLLWLVRYLSATVEWGSEETHRLLDTPLRALPMSEVRVRSVLRDGCWTPVSTTIGTSGPFAAESPCPAWFPGLLARCDGRTTAREHLARLRGEGVVPAIVSDDDFAALIRELADVPLLELDDFPLPVR